MTKRKTTPKKKVGRKSIWEELDMDSRLDMITGWAKQGSTDKDMCAMLGVSETIFYKWKREKPQFKHAIKKGKHDSNGEILNSAFKQTTGYFITKQHPMKMKERSFDPVTKISTETEVIEIVEYEEFIPPNPTMTIFMTKNRLPRDYKDKQVVEHEGELTVKHEGMSDTEIAEKIKELMGKDK